MLSVSVPQDFGLSYLKDALITFKTKYPEIALTVDYDDRVVDLDKENYDFVIRITGSVDSDVASLARPRPGKKKKHDLFLSSLANVETRFSTPKFEHRFRNIY